MLSGTARKVIGGSVFLIAVYLVVFYGKGAAKVESAGSTGGVNLVKAFQGR